MSPCNTVLLCSRSPDDKRDLANAVADLGLEVVQVSRPESMELASNAACVLLVLDLEVDENWRAAVAFLRRRVPSIPIVGYSRLPEVDLWLDALEAGMNDFICKPFYTHEIAWILQNTAHSLELFPAAFQAA